MTLSDFATFSTAISGLAVTASLIYLALQTHQNSLHTKALINQGRIGRISETVLALTSPEMATAFITATRGAPTPAEITQLQFRSYASVQFLGWQDSFSQHERGLLDEDIFVAMRAAVSEVLMLPAYRVIWEHSPLRGTKFSAFVDQIIESLPLS